MSRDGDTLRLTGLNLQVVNGSGATDSQNSLGNVIIGSRPLAPSFRLPHLVIGDRHAYASHSELVSGLGNTLPGNLRFVGGGDHETAGPGACAWLVDVNLVPC